MDKLTQNFKSLIQDKIQAQNLQDAGAILQFVSRDQCLGLTLGESEVGLQFRF